jgi:hypothetical protein
LKFLLLRAPLVHLPHAAGMGRNGRHGQPHGRKHAHQQQHQQRSGDLALHADSGPHAREAEIHVTSIGDKSGEGNPAGDVRPRSELASPPSQNQRFWLTMPPMAKKTAMNNSSLWLFTVILLALAAWLYFR